ncbi:MAG: MarC family integral rane protein [Dehalococcoidia bacterium]|nr:MarC family integral rane protein [Dehalococcoidia bacterium]
MPWTVNFKLNHYLIVAWVVFRYSQGIANFLGKGGLLAFSKVAYLLLVAIAVKLISQGIIDIVTQLQ